jgi:hypothetical protein
VNPLKVECLVGLNSFLANSNMYGCRAGTIFFCFSHFWMLLLWSLTLWFFTFFIFFLLNVTIVRRRTKTRAKKRIFHFSFFICFALNTNQLHSLAFGKKSKNGLLHQLVCINLKWFKWTNWCPLNVKRI